MAKAGNAVIGALKVALGIDTASFETGLKSAQGSLAGFGKSLKTIAKTAGIGAVFGAITAGLKISINTMDDFNKASQKFGIPVEQLSALAYAAELADVSFESLGVGLKKLAVSMSQNSAIFKELGIDIRGLTTEQGLLALADAFRKIPDGANKTAIAIKLLGKSGSDLIPLLNQGSAAIAEQADEARALGLVFSADAGSKAEQFNDNLTRLNRVLTGVFTQIAVGIAGPLADFTDQLVIIAKQADAAFSVVDLFKAILAGLAPVLITTNKELAAIGLTFGALSEAAGLVVSGDFAKVGEVFTRLGEDLETVRRRAEQARSALDAVNMGTRGGAAAAFSRPPAPAADTGPSLEDIDAREKAAKAAADQAEKIKELISDLKFEQQQLGATALQQEINNNLRKAGTEITADQRREIIAATAAAFSYSQDLAQQNETAKRALEQQTQLWEELGRAIESTVLNTLDSLIDKTFTWKDALGDTLRLAASVLANIGSNSISNAGGWGSILQNIPGFAMGGGFTVGGSGGIDSQLVAFRATPGEQVTVSNDGGPMGGFTFAPSTVIDARGSNMSEQQIKAMLDARDRAWREALPGQFKSARIRGKL